MYGQQNISLYWYTVMYGQQNISLYWYTVMYGQQNISLYWRYNCCVCYSAANTEHMNILWNVPLVVAKMFSSHGWLIYMENSAVRARGGAASWGNALQAGRSRVRFTDNRSGHNMNLGSTQPLHEWVLGIFSASKGSRFVGLTNLPPSCVDYLEIWEPQTTGTLMACPGL
jgi:hypothetical protein